MSNEQAVLHNGTSSPKTTATYLLPSDEEEGTRLTDQHQLLKHLFDGRVLLAPITWKEGDRVLDVGTGTGIWLLDLAKEVPKGVHLEGIDIETRHFPPAESRPENAELSIRSLLSLPQDWTDRFTVVHQRLLVAALKKDQWVPAMKELYRITKPGGWVECCEFMKWTGGPVNEQWWELAVTLFDRMGFNLDNGRHVQLMMREAGFEDVQMVVRHSPIGQKRGERGVVQLKTNIAVYESIKPKLLDVGGDLLRSEEEFYKLWDNIQKEYDELECCLVWMVCFGRKPMQ